MGDGEGLAAGDVVLDDAGHEPLKSGSGGTHGVTGLPRPAGITTQVGSVHGGGTDLLGMRAGSHAPRGHAR
jgi:hypothetical protein